MFSWFGKVKFVPYSKVSDFALHLKGGRMMGTACDECGYQTFSPRADGPERMSPRFSCTEYSGKGEVYTFTRTSAAAVGFDDIAPYTMVVVALAEGGRLVGWLGDTLDADAVSIGDAVQVVPRIRGEGDEIEL